MRSRRRSANRCREDKFVNCREYPNPLVSHHGRKEREALLTIPGSINLPVTFDWLDLQEVSRPCPAGTLIPGSVRLISIVAEFQDLESRLCETLVRSGHPGHRSRER